MNSYLKKQDAFSIMTLLFVCIFFFNACSVNKYAGKTTKVKNWVNLQIDFKKGLNDSDKIKTINEIEKYILDHLYQSKLSGILVLNIQFTVGGKLNQDRINLTATLNFGIYDQQAVPIRHPCCLPPVINSRAVITDLTKFETF